MESYTAALSELSRYFFQQWTQIVLFNVVLQDIVPYPPCVPRIVNEWNHTQLPYLSYQSISFNNELGSFFLTLSFKILFHITDGVVDIGKGVDVMNVADRAQNNRNVNV